MSIFQIVAATGLLWPRHGARIAFLFSTAGMALLPALTTLKDACTLFKTLDDCVASLHASGDLQIKFNCLKWDMTAVRPNGDIKSRQAPPKALSLEKAILALKPDVNARGEARNAEKSAREDIKNARS